MKNRKIKILLALLALTTGSSPIAFGEFSTECKKFKNKIVEKLHDLSDGVRDLKRKATEFAKKRIAKIRRIQNPQQASITNAPQFSVENNNVPAINTNVESNSEATLAIKQAIEKVEALFHEEEPLDEIIFQADVESKIQEALDTIEIANDDEAGEIEYYTDEEIEQLVKTGTIFVMSDEGLVDVSTITTPNELLALLLSCQKHVLRNNLNENEYLITSLTVMDYLRNHFEPGHPLFEIAQKGLNQRKASAIEALNNKNTKAIHSINYMHEQLQAQLHKAQALERYLQDEELKKAYEKAKTSEILSDTIEIKNDVNSINI